MKDDKFVLAKLEKQPEWDEYIKHNENDLLKRLNNYVGKTCDNWQAEKEIISLAIAHKERKRQNSRNWIMLIIALCSAAASVVSALSAAF